MSLCGAHDFRSKGQRSRSQGSFQVFVVSAPWLRAYLTDLHKYLHKYSPWHVDVSRSISRSKRSRSHRSFEIKVTPVIRSFCCVHSVASSLFGRITSYVAYIQHTRGLCVAHHFSGWKVKDQGHTSRSKFLPCLLCSSVHISSIHFMWDAHTTHKVIMYNA